MNIRAKIFGQSMSAQSPLVLSKNPKGVLPDALLSIPVSRAQDFRNDTRLEGRFPLSGETVRVTRKGKSHDVELINVCAGGAMIAAPFTGKLHDRVELHLGEHGTIACSVVWIRNGRLGVEFAAETNLDCPDDTQGSLLRDVIKRHYPGAVFSRSSQGTELRTGARHPFIWSGRLHCAIGSTSVRLRNISVDGAMIETPVDLAGVEEPCIDLGEAGRIFGTIVWTAGDQAGVMFHESFDLARLAYAKPELTDEAKTLIRFGAARTQAA